MPCQRQMEIRERERERERTHLDKGQFAGALVLVIDDHLSIKVNPPLTSTKQVVDTGSHLLPLIVVAMSATEVFVLFLDFMLYKVKLLPG